MASFGKDILYATCADDHVRTGSKRLVDSMLKLYAGCLVMITKNIDAEKSMANGPMCRFQGFILKEGTSMEDLQTIIVDGY